MFASPLSWITVISLLLAAPAHGASTAKTAIGEAAATAQNWQADAVLTHVSTLQGRADGKADHWLYTFHSPKAKESAIVTARDRKTEIDAGVRNTSTDALGADFVDSDKVIEATVKAGLKVDKAARNVMYGLVVGNQAVGKPQLFWSVTIMSGDGMSSLTLNGKDGAFIRRNDQKFK
jgi:hypothetical protein